MEMVTDKDVMGFLASVVLGNTLDTCVNMV